MKFDDLSKDLAAQVFDTERISKMFSDAIGPTFNDIGKSALGNLDLSAAEFFAADVKRMEESMKMPALDPALYEVHEPVVRVMEPVRVELPEPPSWLSRNWINLAMLIATLATLAVAITALVRTF